MQNDMENRLKVLEERVTKLEQQTVGLDRIECRELQILSEEGIPVVTLSASEESESGNIKVLGKTGEVLCIICADCEGGVVSVRPAGQGSPNRPGAGGAEMHVDEYGNGYIAAFNPDGGARASLGVAYPDLGGAGLVTVYSPVDNRERVVIGCNPETDNGSIKTYNATWQEAHSLVGESCDLRKIISPTVYDSYRHVLSRIEEKLQTETDETLIHFLNVKKSAISQMLSQNEDNESP